LDLHYEVTAPAKIQPEMNVLGQVLFELRPAREVFNSGLMMRLEDYYHANNRDEQYYYGPISYFALHLAYLTDWLNSNVYITLR